jgi:glutaredoxin
MREAPAVTVYIRAGCPACSEAVTLLRRYEIEPEIVDIDADEELAQRFTDCVPVVLIGGKPRFRGRVNEVLLRRVLRRPGRSASPSSDHPG